MRGGIDFRIYLVTDRTLFENEERFFLAVGDALLAGVRAVQLREKDLGARDLLSMALRMRELTRRHGAKLFVNDRVDIALCAGADGVHLGNAGIPAHAAKAASSGRLLVGVSTHTVAEAEDAERSGADFITFGPVYATPSKMKYGPPAGISALAEAVQSVALPVFAIGGITKENVTDVMRAGAHGIAAISAILGSREIHSDIREIMRSMQ